MRATPGLARWQLSLTGDRDNGVQASALSIAEGSRSAGINVSLETSSMCVFDGEGQLVREVKVLSELEAPVALLGSLGLAFERDWAGAGPVVAVAACKHDARGIVQLMRLGWFKPVCVKTLPTQEVWAVLTACELLGEKLRDVDNSLRNILRGLGWKVAGSARASRAGSNSA